MVRCLSGKSLAQAVESARSNLATSAAGSRKRIFAAASSNASGSPASRQHMVATAAAFSAVISKEEDTTRARSRNSFPEEEPATSASRGGQGEGRHGVFPLASQAQRSTAGYEHGQVGTFFYEGRHLRRCFQKLLEVV